MNIEVKTITKYVVDGEEFDTEQEAKDYIAMNDIEERLEEAFFYDDLFLSNSAYDEITRELPEVIKLFKLAGYEIKDVRGGEA